jgi:hypothetical protein
MKKEGSARHGIQISKVALMRYREFRREFLREGGKRGELLKSA